MFISGKQQHDIQHRYDNRNRIQYKRAPAAIHIIPHHLPGRGQPHLQKDRKGQLDTKYHL